MADDLTDDIYWASKAPEVRAIHELPFDQREAAAQKLDAEGFTIDRQIDIWGWDPTKVMAVRTLYSIQAAPAAAFGGSASAKYIKTSLSAADYPSLTTAPPPPPPIKPVGVFIGNGLYAADVRACIGPNGFPVYQDGIAYPNVNGDGKTYVFHAIPFWGMWSINWTLAS